MTATGLSLPRAHFDAIVVSHVLEHLEDPGQFLRTLHRISFGVMIAEVPLEDLAGSRLKAIFRDRRMNAAGHIQFFTGGTFNALLESSGFNISAHRRYCPVSSLEMLQFAGRRNGISALRQKFSAATGHYLPKYLPFWDRLYYAHYAALCTKSGT